MLLHATISVSQSYHIIRIIGALKKFSATLALKRPVDCSRQLWAQQRSFQEEGLRLETQVKLLCLVRGDVNVEPGKNCSEEFLRVTAKRMCSPREPPRVPEEVKD